MIWTGTTKSTLADYLELTQGGFLELTQGGFLQLSQEGSWTATPKS